MDNYKELNLISKTFFNGINDEITILSNASALINDYIPNISWVGFYLNKNNKLILGPFQGKVAPAFNWRVGIESPSRPKYQRLLVITGASS